eukprot:8467362-Alexandrium_andersonii.AAC.1
MSSRVERRTRGWWGLHAWRDLRQTMGVHARSPALVLADWGRLHSDVERAPVSTLLTRRADRG